MPALLIWLIRLIGVAYVARRAMRGAKGAQGTPTVRGRPGSLDLPDIGPEVGAALREARGALRAMFWSLAGREIVVLVVAGVVVAAAAFLILGVAR